MSTPRRLEYNILTLSVATLRLGSRTRQQLPSYLATVTVFFLQTHFRPRLLVLGGIASIPASFKSYTLRPHPKFHYCRI